MEELFSDDRLRTSSLIKNVSQQLTIDAVIKGKSPGRVFVDDSLQPRTGLIKTPECNLLFGDANNLEFNIEITNKIGYYDAILCDDASWYKNIFEIHPSNALRKYTREYYQYDMGSHVEINKQDPTLQIKLVYPELLENIFYENSEILTDWINIIDIHAIPEVCLAAIVIIDNKIVSCSAIDCFVDNKIEIGIKTIRGYRKKGYGKIAANSLMNESIENGIEQIGWHCVSTNIGSKRIAEECGFKKAIEYQAYSPYPPIENMDDLTSIEWQDYASFYEEKAIQNNDHFWQAAQSWAKAKNIKKSIGCLNRLINNNSLWFIELIPENEEFEYFTNHAEWIKFVKTLQKNHTDNQ
jgi:RimJ/RimL family protein N-acetyltransferase